MTEALHRVSELAGKGAGAVDVAAVPANRLEALVRDGLSAKAQAIDRREPKREVAILVAAVRSLASSAVGDPMSRRKMLCQVHEQGESAFGSSVDTTLNGRNTAASRTPGRR
ncbi:hypothetical protein [Saccharopolyspora shandongensis]|uniref:hypothetical protein n=1 Tax=Saccharopolyspora shandongensis TaxID=418495 RepID=UPI0033C58BBC